MHIPDGYLSPSTCAVLYAASAPFWYVSLQQLKRSLATALVPLLSVFAAFSFVVMMFNLPLPGGTTGHAVGMGIASVVLGPWGAMLAISTALVIQAIFFGDGGITAIGANCFNMGIAGSLVAYGCYRAIAFHAGISSKRRVIAAGLAGYVALNVSALLAAIEFGLQPLLFRDAAGLPLYCPYPLSISVPAMMAGHLTFAGLAELLISAGVVAYLQHAEPSLLQGTAPEISPGAQQLSSQIRMLWLLLAVLVVLSPLGILSTGTAWGEWSPDELRQVPSGIARLFALWSAPVVRYAPSFTSNISLGYMFSAFLGVMLAACAIWLLGRLLGYTRPRQATPFLNKTMRTFLHQLDFSLMAEELASRPGFLQNLDPRVKLAGLVALMIAAVAVQRISALVVLLLGSMVLAVSSRIRIRILATRVWIAVFPFNALVMIPVILLVPGGWMIALRLLLRVECTATFALLLVMSTEWSRILRALRFFRVPAVAVVILSVTYRYFFYLLKSAQEMLEARESRMVGPLHGAESRRLAAASIGVLLSRSLQLSAEVHGAMLSRGFRGEIYLLDELAVRTRDWVYLVLFLGTAATVIGVAR